MILKKHYVTGQRCSASKRQKCVSSSASKFFDVKNTYYFYILNNNNVAICTPLSVNHGINDSNFIDNYKRNFQKHPWGDINFSFMAKTISLFENSQSDLCPFIYTYAPNIIMGYNVAVRAQASDKSDIFNQIYTPMFHQWIKHVEDVSNEITRPFAR